MLFGSDLQHLPAAGSGSPTMHWTWSRSIACSLRPGFVRDTNGPVWSKSNRKHPEPRRPKLHVTMSQEWVARVEGCQRRFHLADSAARDAGQPYCQSKLCGQIAESAEVACGHSFPHYGQATKGEGVENQFPSISASLGMWDPPQAGPNNLYFTKVRNSLQCNLQSPVQSVEPSTVYTTQCSLYSQTTLGALVHHYTVNSATRVHTRGLVNIIQRP